MTVADVRFSLLPLALTTNFALGISNLIFTPFSFHCLSFSTAVGQIWHIVHIDLGRKLHQEFKIGSVPS